MLDGWRVQELKVVVDAAREDTIVRKNFYLNNLFTWVVRCTTNEYCEVSFSRFVLYEFDI